MIYSLQSTTHVQYRIVNSLTTSSEALIYSDRKEERRKSLIQTDESSFHWKCILFHLFLNVIASFFFLNCYIFVTFSVYISWYFSRSAVDVWIRIIWLGSVIFCRLEGQACKTSMARPSTHGTTTIIANQEKCSTEMQFWSIIRVEIGLKTETGLQM